LVFSGKGKGILTPTPPDAIHERNALRRFSGPVVLAVALLPAVAAVWVFPGFVTQDGPAHLYNADILVRSFDPNSPFRHAFSVRWEPLPNWAGHITLMGLVSALPPRAADRAMTTLTLAGLAGSVVWLRWGVAGERGMATAAVLAVALGMNVAWLLGFASFLLGACLFAVTLGVWWSGRDRGFTWRSAGVLAGLTTLGYFCHLVSLGLTAFGIVVLELFTPGRNRLARASGTAVGLAPLAPLGTIYLGLMKRGGGGLAPEWKHLDSPFSPPAWVEQLRWVDPISLARKDVLPLVEGLASPWCGLLAPVLWLAVGVGLAVVAACVSRRAGDRDREHLGWWVLAGALLIGGIAGPDSLGAAHGEYLPQRIVLLGLVALVPVLSLDAKGWLGRASSVAIVVALVIQSAFVWDYARTSERTAGALFRASNAVGRGQRVATLLLGIKTRFRANPLLHADCALGVGTGNTIWGDYETRFYYFPVRFRPGLDRPDPAELEAIALSDAPEFAGIRACRWACLLDQHRDAIDVILVWGSDPALDALHVRAYRIVYIDGPVRVLRRK
jgi:hypothetical protein